MQTQERDELDREVIADIARDWYEMGPARRARVLAAFPELAQMGLKVGDPCDTALVADHEETLRQAEALENGPGATVGAAHVADEPNLRDQLNSGAPAAPPPPDVAAGLRKDARAAVDWSATNAARQQKRPTLGATKTAFRFRDVARRRRVLAALKSEKELAAALGGHHGPDSEPWDVIHLHDPLGNVITDPQHVRHALEVRAKAVERLKQSDLNDGQRAFLQKIVDTPAHAFEVKTLLTTAKNYVQVTPKALAAKKAWAEKHGVAFHLVSFDKRRGRKHSGNALYFLPNGVGEKPTVALKTMQAIPSPNEVLSRLASQTHGE